MAVFSNPSTQTLMTPNPNFVEHRPKKFKFAAASISCRATKLPGERETSNYNTKNYYKLLSLSPTNASAEEIKRAYRTMALRYHPDVCNDPSMKEESTRMFVRLNDAYKTLSDPVLRREYDWELGLVTNYGYHECRRKVWQEQILELKRRSVKRMAQQEGYCSWSCRMRARNNATAEV